MQINIIHNNFEITEAIKEYTYNKFSQIEKHLDKKEGVKLSVEFDKISNHHKHGNHYEVKATLALGSRKIFVESVKEDLYAAIEVSKDKLLDEMSHNGDKKRDIMKKISRRFKNFIKNL